MVLKLQILMDTYERYPRPTTVNKPRSNEIGEIIHLTMQDITSKSNLTVLDWKKEINILLQTVSWDLRSTAHNKYGSSP